MRRSYYNITLEKNATIYGIGLDKAGSMADLNRYDPLAMKAGEVPWYTTTLLLARRETLFDVGGFDVDYYTNCCFFINHQMSYSKYF